MDAYIRMCFNNKVMVLKLISLIFVVVTGLYSFSQDKCELTIGSAARYVVLKSVWGIRTQRLDNQLEDLGGTLSRLEQIMNRTVKIIENLEKITQSTEDHTTLEQSSKFDDMKENVKNILSFINRYHEAIGEFNKVVKDFFSLMHTLESRESEAMNRSDKLSFYDRSRRAIAGDVLSFYYQNQDQLKTTFRNTEESRKKLRSMKRELKRVEKFLTQIEKQITE